MENGYVNMNCRFLIRNVYKDTKAYISNVDIRNKNVSEEDKKGQTSKTSRKDKKYIFKKKI